MTTSINRVLIVDDDPILRARVAAYFAGRENAFVEEAANGTLAYAIITEPANTFDLIMCDLNMPDMDGIEFLSALAEAGYKGAIAIISGEERVNIQMAGMLAEHNGLNLVHSFQKPVSNDQLEQLSTQLKSAEPAVQTSRSAVAGN